MPLTVDRFSIISCSHKRARREWIRAQYARAFPTAEIIVIEDAVSLCEGYARGLTRASHKRLIFTHDDIEFVFPGSAEATVSRHLDEFDLFGIAGTTKLAGPKWTAAGDPYCFMLVLAPDDSGPDTFNVQMAGNGGAAPISSAQALDGVFLACRREVAEAVGFDAETFDGFHLYDLDFTYRAYLRGFRLAICRDLPLIHYGSGILTTAWESAAQRFAQKHGFVEQSEERRPQFSGMRGTRAQLAAFCGAIMRA